MSTSAGSRAMTLLYTLITMLAAIAVIAAVMALSWLLNAA